MKTSKYLVFGLSLALALSLASCGGQQSGQEPQKPDQEVQQTEQVSTPPAVEPTATTTEPVVLNEVDTTGEVEDAGANEPAETMQLFNDCNETVYTTGTVNVRSSWSADSDKLDSLNAGESVTRTGTSIAGTEAEGWSRVQLGDGTTAYISNNYLSTTKPVTQSVSSSTTQTTQQTQQQGGSQVQQVQGGVQLTEDENRAAAEAAGGGIAGMDAWVKEHPAEPGAHENALNRPGAVQGEYGIENPNIAVSSK